MVTTCEPKIPQKLTENPEEEKCFKLTLLLSKLGALEEPSGICDEHTVVADGIPVWDRELDVTLPL